MSKGCVASYYKLKKWIYFMTRLMPVLSLLLLLLLLVKLLEGWASSPCISKYPLDWIPKKKEFASIEARLVQRLCSKPGTKAGSLWGTVTHNSPFPVQAPKLVGCAKAVLEFHICRQVYYDVTRSWLSTVYGDWLRLDLGWSCSLHRFQVFPCH